ncbi:tannase/feruloyl esterase family alpha/beta hydrolase [Paenibacillus doosanensis]|uniref:tannase/feruloyl esterase family alpha/beta hydrolase n=1 Tax=Paenibacillus doosanensis TaxID=1229154 RepID=UPI00217F606B|nr:tannase/feruloyl esterase family alpha/beta hydrolase [Paenibacillus doosanensis]MCS7461449.1 tannase/feruloyl esterase family alpha/beta hydrolase [Paenibacillus doosanensis]
MINMRVSSSDISLPTNGAVIKSVDVIQATAPGNVHGEYCKVLGTIMPADPDAPEICFQINLPAYWNGKALQIGGGGYNGTIPDTLAAPVLGLRTVATPLAQGYITFASDSGHQAKGGHDASFALNDEALANYGYMHIKKTRDVAFEIAKKYYGGLPRRLYFSGGSTGGREGLTAVMRWPESYDGILTNYPTAHFIGLRLWGARLARALYDDTSKGWISPDIVERIHQTALDRFDDLDGIRDGVVCNIYAARAQSNQVIEELVKEFRLNGSQISTLNLYHDGCVLPYSLANGVTAIPGYNSLEGILMQLGSHPEPSNPMKSGPNAHHAERADQFFKYFVTRDPQFNLLSLDVNNPGKYEERIVELSNMIDATNPDLTPFQMRGGKILWVQGWHDPSVSPFANINLYKSMLEKMGESAVASFIRLYLVPGLAHGGGKFSVTWDNLNILDNWVENSVPPPIAPGMDINLGAFGRTIPMCEYPTWPKYSGTGDANDWKSYDIVKA